MPTKSVREVFDGFKLECVKCGPDGVVVEDEVEEYGSYRDEESDLMVASRMGGVFWVCCNKCEIRTKIVDLET
jgi:hypothetical protein